MVIGDEELEGQAGITHTSCSVDAWSQSVGDITLTDAAQLQVGLTNKCQQTGLLCSIEFLQTQAHQCMVLPQQGGHVCDRPDGYQIKQVLFIYYRTVVLAIEGLYQLKSNAHATEITL